ncbi:hypothetical protein FRC17_004818 [Serendipita sp. 399]|nr:hypothetical protein FRC17_004818 [Serendipita sp. 399]
MSVRSSIIRCEKKNRLLTPRIEKQNSPSKEGENVAGSNSGDLSLEKTNHRRIAVGELLVILSLLGLVVASIVVIILIFAGASRRWEYIPSAVTILQTGIAALALPVMSAVLRLLAQRYVYARICDKGLRSRRIANFNNWSITEVLGQIMAARLEPLGALLLTIWLLSLATGFTVRESAKLAPLFSRGVSVPLPVGPLDRQWGDSFHDSLVPVTSGTISSLASAISTETEGFLGYINVTNAYAGSVYYPPVKVFGSFAAPAYLNGLQVEVSHLESVPSPASMLNCTRMYGNLGVFWLLRNTTTTLSFVYGPEEHSNELVRVDSTAVVLAGCLSVQRTGPHPYAHFEANGTTMPLVMNAQEWASEFLDIVCSAGLAKTIYTYDGTMRSFGYGVNQRDMYDKNSGLVSQKQLWSTIMGTVMGAYSANTYNSPAESEQILADMTMNTKFLAPTYGAYVLIANTLISVVLLCVVSSLFRASPLNRDFLDSTRLLLSPLEDPELFNATLDATIRKLEDPHVQVVSSHQLLVSRSKKVDASAPSLIVQ